MDLKSLMNTESSEAKGAPPQRESIPQAHAQSQSQAQAHAHAQAQSQAYAQLQLQTQQRNSIQPPPPRAASGSYGSPASQHTPYASKPAPPLYQQSPIDSRASNGAIPAPRLSTPLHTPVQTPGQIPAGAGAGYPFPSGPYQSPSQGQQQQQQQQQYRGHDGYQVVTPGGSRPPAPLYQQQHGQQAASSPYGAPQAPASAHHSASHSHTSMSPTPPTLHHQSQSQTQMPHPARESAASASQSYNHHPYSMHAHHPSQPSTPLGPPSAIQYPRQFAQPQSPYGLQHHRTSSGASHGPTHSMASNSPAQPMPMGLGGMAESPAAYNPPGPLRRAASGGYVSEAERERSISVSPKTRVIPRQGSQGSFYSSHDPMSARNSISASQADYDRPSQSHPSHPSHQAQPQHEPQHIRSSDDMSHGISPLTNTRQQPIALQHAAPVPSPSSRSSQTPKLMNLLNDTGMVAASPVRQSSATAPASSATPQRQFSPHSHPPPSDVSRQSSNSYEAAVKLEPAPLLKSESSGFPRESLLQQPVTTPAQAHTPIMPNVQKRPATTTPESAHPVKRVKKRYAEPPIWARFAKSNPRYGNNPQSLAPPPQQLARRPSPHSQARAASGQHPPPTNGHAPQVVTNGTPTATQTKLPPPVNSRLGPWEPNVRNMQLIDDVVKDVGDFLFYQVTRMDIGVGDLRSGTLEIEAKLGTIIDKRTNNRVATMGISNTVLDTAVTGSGNLRFESFMTELQHKQMNDFLNKMVQASMGPNRVKMNYKHRYERDSFAQLNQYGLAALPPAAKAHLRPGQVPKLRTSVDTRAPEGSPQAVLGRIVKVRLDDLDIHCPKMDFDCRISVNVEVDLNNRPDVDPSMIVDQMPPDSAGDRMKDRLSYQHLAYSVDLTQVTGGGGKKSHELEVEVDTARLREEAVRLQRGQDSGYEAMVDGLLSNVFMLMKASKDMGRQGGPQ